MALINCPNCGKEVSDKAKICPSCGESITIGLEIEKKETSIICEDCGTEYQIESLACPNCGCPNPSKNVSSDPIVNNVDLPTTETQKKTGKSKLIVFGIIIVCLVLVSFLIKGIVDKNNMKKAAAEYETNLSTVTSLMLSGASKAEDTCGLIHDVWYNTIYEERDSSTDKYTRRNSGYGSFYDDFNDSLANLFSDTTFSLQISSIKTNQTSVQSIMKELKNPPAEYENAYDAVKDLYDAYLELTDLVINPKGSLQSFTSSYNTADSNVLKYYKAAQLYVD